MTKNLDGWLADYIDHRIADTLADHGIGSAVSAAADTAIDAGPALPVGSQPAAPERVTLTHAEREAIADELVYEVPEHHHSLSWDGMQDQLAPRLLWACARRNDLQLHRRDDVTFDDPDVLDWMAARVFRTTVEHVLEDHVGDDDYQRTWASLEIKFGVDRAQLGNPDDAQARGIALDEHARTYEPPGLLRIAERVAAICDANPAIRDLEG